jgi:DNA-binding response OmpR family regulator
MDRPRLLIVEDDPDVGSGLEMLFQADGFMVERETDGKDGLQRMTNMPPFDAILLDVMLPHRSGFDVLREARRAGVDAPVVMLTVKARDEEKLQAFHLGADDYVTKPFDPRELVARVRAVIRRSSRGRGADQVMKVGDMAVDLANRQVSRDGRTLQFTTLEFDILQYFVRHRGRTVSRKQMLRDVWGISGEIATRTIDRHVASLRKKIEPDGDHPQYIETVYGIGYKFIA